MLVKEEESYIENILNEIRDIGYIKPEDIPNIDLYMDQVTTFMDEHLKSSKRYDDDKMLTKTMINNYTKNNLLPSPHKKKYSKEHMLLLIFIYYFKNILSINDIQQIFTPLTERFYSQEENIQLEDIYREVFSLEHDQMDSLVKDVIRKQKKASSTFEQVEEGEDKDFLTTFSLVCMLGFDVYVKKMMIEKIIDKEIGGIGKQKMQTEKKEKK